MLAGKAALLHSSRSCMQSVLQLHRQVTRGPPVGKPHAPGPHSIALVRVPPYAPLHIIGRSDPPSATRIAATSLRSMKHPGQL